MAHKQGCPFGVDKAAFFSCTCRHPMTDIPEELVEEVCEIMCCEGFCGKRVAGLKCTRHSWRYQALSAIRAVLDWQASNAIAGE